MKKTSIVGVWLIVVTAAVIETVLFYQNPDGLVTEATIGAIAAAAAIATVAYSMGLKDEEGAVRYILLVPVMLLAVLLITMLFAYPVAF